MKSIKFIVNPDQLSNLDMDALRGGLVGKSDDCNLNCGTYCDQGNKLLN